MSNPTVITSTSASRPLSLTRRRVLQWMAAACAATAMGAYPLLASAAPTSPGLNQGYGPDPDLNNPPIPWGKSLSAEQLEAVRLLGDLIIPADAHSPKASDLDIADFVNEWLSAPYPQQQADRKIVLSGLRWLDQQAQTAGQQIFIKSPDKTRATLFDQLATAVATESASDAQAEFFNKIIFLFVGGFYTTQEGMKDIGYVGNVPLQKFEGPPPEIRRRLGV